MYIYMNDIHVYIQWTAPGKKTKTKKNTTLFVFPCAQMVVIEMMVHNGPYARCGSVSAS